MKKLLLLPVLVGLAISYGCSKVKKRQHNIVRYNIDGVQREITGGYSNLTLYGLEYELNSDFWIVATDKNTLSKFSIGGSGNMPPIGSSVNFETAAEGVFRMILHNRSANSSNTKSFVSISGRSGGCSIQENDANHISGIFSGTLYYKGMFGTDPISDSVVITDGYFYINKQ